MDIVSLINTATGKLIVPPGTYEVDVDRIKVPANVHLVLTGVTIKAKPTSDATYAVIQIQTPNVTIENGHIIGERDGHLGTPEKVDQWGMCIKIKDGAKNVLIKGTRCSKGFGDGFYIGGGEDITLSKVEADENRRQGVSVVTGKNIKILDSIFRDTGGHAPQCGIDVEPDKAPGVNGCLIKNCKVLRNKGYGVTLFARNGPVRNTKVEGVTYQGNAMGTLRLVNILSGFQDILYDLGWYKPTSITVT